MGKDSLRPATNEDRDGWRAYWVSKEMSWRTDPEIDPERAELLRLKSFIQADIEKGVYPFKGMKLSRADIEWLLASLDDGRGPVQWDDVAQRKRVGLDLRGADLTGVDFHDLPLARSIMAINQNLSADKIDAASVKFQSDEPNEQVTIHMENVHLEGATLVRANLRGAVLTRAHLEGADLRAAHLEGANVYHAHLQGAVLSYAHLENAELVRADLERTDMQEAYLAGANLRLAAMNPGTLLDKISLTSLELGAVRLADVRWGGANLTVVNWRQIPRLGDDAHVQSNSEGVQEGLTIAVRANRQVATALRAQGLHEEANIFAYTTQVLQRDLYWHAKMWPDWFFSSFLQKLAGYGYKWQITLIWYLGLLLLSTGVYFSQGLVFAHPNTPCITILGTALVDAFTALHGRGFFPSPPESGLQMATAAFDAVAGLLIEASFIATFTQRYFGR